jgi:hypothetical protein
MKLTWLDLGGCVQVRDLAPLQGMPLTSLQLWGCDQVRDLTPLQGMPLQVVSFTPKNITKGIEGVRRIESLKKIGIHPTQALPPEEFWKKYDAKEFSK